MRDEDKTKEQLISELAEMRQRVAELETAVTERKRAEEELRRRSQALSTLHQISQELTSTLDLDQILQAIAEDTVRLTGAARSLFLVIDPQAQQMVLATGHGYSREHLEGFTFEEFEAGLSGWVRREGKPALVTDAQADPRQTGIALEHAKQLGSRFLAIAPLWIKGEVVGTLTAVGTAETPAFTEETLELVVMLANQAAIAIENAQLYQAERKRRRVADTLRQVATILNSTLELRQVLDLILEHLAQVVPYDSASVMLVSGDMLRVMAARGFPDVERAMQVAIPVAKDTFFQEMLRTRQPVVLTDAQKDERFLAAGGTDYVRGWVGAPLVVKGRVIGNLTVDSRQPGAYGQEEAQTAAAFADQAAIAIENARLYEETRRRAERLAMINRIAGAAGATLHLDELVEIVYQEVARIFQADAFFLALYDSETNELNFRLRVDEGTREPPERRPMEAGLTATVVTTKKPLLIRDFEKEKDRLPPARIWGTMKIPPSWLGVPMLIGDQVVGVISVQAYRSQAYGEEEQQLLSTIADQVAVAVENARLFQAEREQRELAEALEEAATALSSTLDPDQVLDRILEQVERVVAGDVFNIMLIEDDVARAVRWRGYERLGREDFISQFTIPIVRYPSLTRMVQSGKPIVVPDTAADPDWVRQEEEMWMRSYVGAPILVSGVTVGLLNVGGIQPGQFDPADARRLQAFADHAAAAIENARLYEETRRWLAREERLNELAHALGGEMELATLIPRLLPPVAELTGADAGTVAVLDPERQVITYPYHYNLPDALAGVEVPAGSGLAGHTMRVRQPVLLDDYGEHPAALQPWVEAGVCSMLAVPLLVGDQVVGALGLFSLGEVRPFGPEAVATAEAAGRLAAVAIQRARLFEAEQRQRQEAETLREVAKTLNQALSLEEMLDIVLREAMALMGRREGSIILLDPRTNTMRIVANYGLSPEVVEAFNNRPVYAHEGTFGVVLRTGEMLEIPDTRSDPRVLHELGRVPEQLTNVPLRTEEGIIGVIALDALPPNERTRRLLLALADLAAIAIQRARLFEMERQQRQEAETLREAALTLTADLDRNQVIARILSQLQQVVPYDSASVQLLQEDKLVIIGGRGFPNLEEILGISFPVDGDNPNREVMRTLSPFILEDAPAVYEGFRQEPFAAMGIRSWLGVPMLIGKRPVGMITLDKCQPGFYNEEHARLAQAFAAQAAIAIENARLFEEEQRRATQLAVVNEVGRHATSTLELDQILRDVTTAIQTGFRYYNVTTFLVEGDHAVLKAIAGGFAEVVKDGYRQHLSQGIVGWCITHDQTWLANDVSRDPHFIPGFLEEVETQSELCVPIRVDGKVVGALDVQSTELNAFDQWDVRALETLSDQVALAVKNALTYGRLDEEKGRLELLYQVAAEVNRSLDLDEILGRAIERITATLGGERGYVFLVEPGTDRIRLRAVSGVEVPIAELNEVLDVHLGQGVVGWVAAHREAAVVDDVTQDERWLYVDELDRGIRSVMSVPLVRGEETLGALSVLHPTPGFFDQEQCRLLMAVAQQVAVAVANARLHEAAKEQAMLDSLTQVYNHGELIRRLHVAVEEGARENQPVSYIMLDIDYFKEYNDRYGHVIGDLILRAIVQAIRGNIKKTDIAGRWGGEEFGIVLPRTDSEQAQIVAQRIRHTLATMPLTDDKGQEVPRPTVSQGIATYPTTASSAEELIDLADAALYRAKARGRDQVDVVR